jgi:hypothetical protein
MDYRPPPLPSPLSKQYLWFFPDSPKPLKPRVQPPDQIDYRSLILSAQPAKFNSERIGGGMMNYFAG